MSLLPPESYTARRLEHASPQHLANDPRSAPANARRDRSRSRQLVAATEDDTRTQLNHAQSPRPLPRRLESLVHLHQYQQGAGAATQRLPPRMDSLRHIDRYEADPSDAVAACADSRMVG